MIKKTLHRASKLLTGLFKKTSVFRKKLYFGKAPYGIDEDALILFPYLPGRLSCGLTAMLAFRRAGDSLSSPQNTKNAESIETIIKTIRAQGLPEPGNDASPVDSSCLGGPEAAEKLFYEIKALKQQDNFHGLVCDKQESERLEKTLETLAGLTGDETRKFNRWTGLLSARVFDQISARIENLKDASWCLKTEVIGNIEKVRDLLGNQANPAKSAVYAARQINSVFNSIDRLEVRGRDSAGISIIFVLSRDSFGHFEKTLQSRNLEEEFGYRAQQSLLTNRNISVRHSQDNTGREISTVALTYKVAAEIGRLGDNIAFLRSQVRNDEIFHCLVNIEHEHFTVSAHTRWASVGEISEANCHPVDAATVSAPAGETAIIHASLNGDIDNYQNLKAAHRAAGIRYPEEITCDTKIIPVHVASYLNRGHDIEEAFRLAVNDFEGS
ncbi:MAG: glutamine--fructose-6-phosphate aminotransferase, partial [Desulfosalsimonas sp.]